MSAAITEMVIDLRDDAKRLGRADAIVEVLSLIKDRIRFAPSVEVASELLRVAELIGQMQ